MSDIDLHENSVVKHSDSFHGLPKKPAFSICDDIHAHILFVKRKDKYYGVRTGSKADFESCEQFLIYSCLVEEIRARIKNNLTLEHLTVEEYSNAELRKLYSKASGIKKHLPIVTNVERSYTIANGSDLNWIFVEEKTKYHSVFWNESESKLFSRCA